MSKAKSIMSSNVAYCLPTATVEEVAQTMKTMNIGSVPAVENLHNKKLVGIVTDRDLAVRVIGEQRDPRRTAVNEVMTKNAIHCQEEDSIEHCLELMTQHRVRRLPVVDSALQLVGIISEADIAAKLKDPNTASELLKAVSSAIIESQK